MHLRSLLALSAVVAASILGCGGGGPQAKAPSTEAKAEPTAGASADGGGGGSTPATKARYPEPFLEPDCGSVGTDGFLPNAKAVVAKVHQDGWAKLKQCVANADDVHGEVRVSFRLDPDGVPRCVEAPGSSLADDEIVHCVIAVYRTFHYPSPQNGSVRVTDGIAFDVSEEEE